MSEASDTGSLDCRLVVIERCTIMRRALGRQCSAICTLDVGYEMAEVGDAFQALGQPYAILVFLGPSIGIADCLELQARLVRSPACPRILTLQMCPRPDDVLLLVQRGVCGILDEDASEQELALALAVVAVGQSFMGRHVRALLAAAPPTKQAISLTHREREVIGLLARGESNDGIARQLGLSVKTVEMHLNHLYGKLRVRSRTQALVRAQELNLLETAALPAPRRSRR